LSVSQSQGLNKQQIKAYLEFTVVSPKVYHLYKYNAI